jgi:hypothetical protein
LGAWSVVGCGGSGSRSSLPSASGVVQFPSGFNQKLGPLQVVNGLGSSAVSSKQSFSVATAGEASSLAFVLDNSNRVIFAGFVAPGMINNLGATSTAAALLFFALGGYGVDLSNVPTVVELIASSPATATLASTISNRVAANPYAVDQNDSAICAALATAVNSFKASASEKRVARARTDKGGSDELTIEGGTQSGFTVSQATDQTGFVGQNAYRRYCRVYVYETATTNSSGTTTQLPVAQQIGNSFDVPSTTRLNVFTALGDIFTSTSPFSPIQTATQPL